VLAWGEQRACATADFDGDGRPDLALAQNRGATLLFRNVGARPGLRVRLEGPAENPAAIGARLRLGDAKNPGVAREIRAGGGYWSQDSAWPVMALPSGPATLRVTWPGGGSTETAVPSGAREVRVRRRGDSTEIVVVR
jgi:hypothetical protein